MGADKEGLHILHSVVEIATAEMKDNKSTGGDDDDVPPDVFKLFREDGFSTVTQQINKIYENGEWPKNFSDVNSDCLKEEAKSYKMQRPSHNQLDHKYCKDGGQDTWTKF